MLRAVLVIFIGLSLWAPAPAQSAAIVEISPLAIPQGGVVVVNVATAGGGSLRVRFNARLWPLYPYRGGWRTYLGTDPETAPGRRSVVVEAVTARGAVVLARRIVQVVKVFFPVRRLTLDPAKQKLLDPKLVALERAKVNAALRGLSAPQLWVGQFRIPVGGSVSSPYGVVSVYQGRVQGYHRGTDIAAPAGTPVHAANDGIVRLADALPLSGNAVMIDHGMGIVTSYLHMSVIRVRPGQRIKKGDVIGDVGSTGLSTGPHLHWGLRTNGVLVNPLSWMNTVP